METDELSKFLSQARTCMKNIQSFKYVMVVLGNETCDLDSAISSLAYSLLLNRLKTTESVVIPVFNIPREHLPMKTEVTYFLNKLNIDLNNVTCRNEINLEELNNKDSLKLILLDHHVLPPADAYLAASVVSVIDHRPHDPSWPWTSADVTLRSVGSCCTLVAEKLFSQAPDLVSPNVAILLWGAILLDTACLSSEVGIATSLDHQMATKLQGCCSSLSIGQDQLFRDLKRAKSDISSLTSSQLLLKDLKVTARIPVAGLPIKVQEFLKREDAKRAVQDFCEAYKTKVCVVYGSEFAQGTVTRDLAVYNHADKNAALEIVAALKSNKDPSLDLQPQPCSVEGFMLFEQFNIKATRKQVLPIIRQVGEKILPTS
uniref:DHHA2 domain-containing protein n=1 Tax=Graphocephala atropunctata TaxID=36148 RepID=A0A1B6KJ61_9HEMI